MHTRLLTTDEQYGRVSGEHSWISSTQDLNQPVFTCCFRYGATGAIEFGYVDDSLYTGELTKVLVANETGSSWTVEDVLFSIGMETTVCNAQAMLLVC